jgi:GNAT superfamily N-acetyltransferase
MKEKTKLTVPTTKLVSVDQIIDLRHRILREGQPIASTYFKGDEEPQTAHYATFIASRSEPIGCASFILNPYDQVPAWQLRGMAIDQAYRGQGIGKQILEVAEEDLQSDIAYFYVKRMWCNARESAVLFYEKNGWKRVSDVFDIPLAGPHIRMTKDIRIAPWRDP